MRQKVLILFILTALLLITSAIQAQPNGVDPNARDTLIIDSVRTTSTSFGFVPIYFHNDEELAGLEMTIFYNSSDIFIDSFSFVGSRLNYLTFKGSNPVTNNSVSIHAFVGSENLIQPGTGLLGQVYFSFIPNISQQTVLIDTATITIGDREYSIAFSDATSNAFSPHVIPGMLNISTGSCCLGDIGNANGSPDDIYDISDLLYLVDYFFKDPAGPAPVCMEESNLNGSSDGILDISDLLYGVDHMFGDGPPPPSCP